MSRKKIPVFTIGHSTRKFSEFAKILEAYGVKELVDVRTIAKSRKNPQFNGSSMGKKLKKYKIAYLHMKSLGGLRHSKKDSINTAWRNASFRGFADYMQTPEFRAALKKLMDLARKKPVAVMCAEAVPWRCHRSLIGDALVIGKIDVQDIYSATNSKPHRLTPWAKVCGAKITYPGR